MAAAIHTPGETELQRITCPYCVIGYAVVEVKVNAAQMTKQIAGIADPRRCVTCKRYFRLKPTVQIVGVRLEN